MTKKAFDENAGIESCGIHDLTGRFLVATAQLNGTNFEHAVILMVGGNEEGAMGLMVNRPSETSFGELFKSMNIECRDPALRRRRCGVGGPVGVEHGFIVHRPPIDSEDITRLHRDLGVTSGKQFLKRLAEGEGPEDAIIVFGFSGWGAGQLEKEIIDNSWLCVAGDASIIFDAPIERRWEAALRKFGGALPELISGAGSHIEPS